jgi:hypothetical protein
MYYNPVSTAITFIFIFLVVEAVFSVVAWRSIVSRWQAASTQALLPPPTKFDPKKKPDYQEDHVTNGEEGETWEETEKTESSSKDSEAEQEQQTDADSEVEVSRRNDGI